MVSRRVVRRRIFTETRRARLSALHASWNAQMPRLVRAYLAWKYGPSDGDSDGDDSDSQHMDDAVDGIFHVTAIGITGELFIRHCLQRTYHLFSAREHMRPIRQKHNELANISLIREGLLGCSPEAPSVAFSLETLELYHRLRRRHGQLSIQTMARVLCDFHDVSYYYQCI